MGSTLSPERLVRICATLTVGSPAGEQGVHHRHPACGAGHAMPVHLPWAGLPLLRQRRVRRTVRSLFDEQHCAVVKERSGRGVESRASPIFPFLGTSKETPGVNHHNTNPSPNHNGSGVETLLSFQMCFPTPSHGQSTPPPCHRRTSPVRPATFANFDAFMFVGEGGLKLRGKWHGHHSFIIGSERWMVAIL